MTTRSSLGRVWSPALALALPLALMAGCASGPKPDAALASGSSSLEAARAAGAPELAAVEIGDARNKLDQARTLAQAGRSRDAIRMAEQADADAQLARARASSERARRAVDEVDASLKTLREELARNAAPARLPQ